MGASMDIDTSFFSLFRQMFIQGTVAKIGGTAFTVYCAIKAHVNFNTGRAFPSQKLLAQQTGFSERQVIKSLKVLEQHGLLEKSRKHTHNVYHLKERLVLDEKTVAVWDYLPATLKKARQELQNFALTGEWKDAKVIHIEIQTLPLKPSLPETRLRWNWRGSLIRFCEPRWKNSLRIKIPEYFSCEYFAPFLL
jgi:hypothetical protein